MSGIKVIAAIFAGIAASFALAGIGFLVFTPEASPCTTGEMSENRFIGPQFETRVEQFESVSDAGAFICHRVPELDAEDWELTRVSAERTVPTEFLVQGYGVGVVTQDYTREATGDTITLQTAPYDAGPTYFSESIPPNATSETVTIQGFEATAYRFGINPDLVHLQWTSSTMQHQAIVQLTPTLQLEDLPPILDTYR